MNDHEGHSGRGGASMAPRVSAEHATNEHIEWLVAELGHRLYRVAVAIVRDRHAAEDVVQEVLVKAWSSMPSWEGDVPIRWARTVTRNTALSYLRSMAARPVLPTEHLDQVASQLDGADDLVIRRETSERMWAALGKLGEDERGMLILQELDGASYEELAATFDISVSAVKSKLYRARMTLRSEVAR